jgi:hypothetical protein
MWNIFGTKYVRNGFSTGILILLVVLKINRAFTEDLSKHELESDGFRKSERSAGGNCRR